MRDNNVKVTRPGALQVGLGRGDAAIWMRVEETDDIETDCTRPSQPTVISVSTVPLNAEAPLTHPSAFGTNALMVDRICGSVSPALEAIAMPEPPATSLGPARHFLAEGMESLGGLGM